MSTSFSMLAAFVMGMGGMGYVDCGAGVPNPVLDLPASTLELRPSISDTAKSPMSKDQLVSVQFYQNGMNIDIADKDSITCNGIRLTSGLGAYLAWVPKVAPGGSYTFVYSRGGMNTPVALVVPPRPSLTSPHDGQIVLRTEKYALSYDAADGQTVIGRAYDSASKVTSYTVPEGDAVTMDTLGLLAGPGHVELLRTYALSPKNTGFAAVNAEFTIGSQQVGVTWK